MRNAFSARQSSFPLHAACTPPDPPFPAPTPRLTGKSTRLLNLGSYNYLGFAENAGPCAEASIEAVKKYGVTSSSPRAELGA